MAIGINVRRLWRVVSLGFCGLVLILAVTREAGAQTAIFGPKEYAKPKGGAVTHTDSFTSPYPAGSYSLWVQTGPNGLKNATSVSVKLNGTVVLTSTDLQSSNPASKPITLSSGSNTLGITLSGQSENSITVQILCNDCSPIRITSPVGGVWIEAPYVTVTGELISGLGEDASVMVNGVAALVSDGRFIANHIPVDWMSPQLIKAELVDASGNRSEASITVYGVRSGQQYVSLVADAYLGTTPLALDLTAEGTTAFVPVTTTLDCGLGGTIQQGSLSEFQATLSEPGLYLCTVTAINAQNTTCQNTVGILAQTREGMDSSLQAKWTGMKTALASSDVEKAVGYYAESSRDNYRQQFTAMAAQLPQIAADMGPITLERIDQTSAIYDLRTVRNGTVYSFQLTFVRDGDGIWRIRNY